MAKFFVGLTFPYYDITMTMLQVTNDRFFSNDIIWVYHVETKGDYYTKQNKVNEGILNCKTMHDIIITPQPRPPLYTPKQVPMLLLFRVQSRIGEKDANHGNT